MRSRNLCEQPSSQKTRSRGSFIWPSRAIHIMKVDAMECRSDLVHVQRFVCTVHACVCVDCDACVDFDDTVSVLKIS